MNPAHEFLTSGNIEMMEYVRQQDAIVSFAEFDLDRADGPGRIAVRHTEFRGVLLRYLQYRGPIHRNDPSIGVAFCDGDSKHPVAGGDVQHLAWLALCGARQVGDELGRRDS